MTAARGLRHAALAGLLAAAAGGGWLACQDGSFDYQPGYDFAAAHFVFRVQTPSKADLLFVVDSSGSMREEQDALRASILALLNELARRDTDYRVGVTSTDMVEQWGDSLLPCDADSDCHGQGLPSSWECKHDCPDRVSRCVERVTYDLGDGATEVPLCVSPIHDGKRGRLIAVNDNGHVLDRRDIAAIVGPADAEREIARRLAENIFGIGVYGSGYEQGLKASAWAVGVNPDDVVDPINPALDLTLPGQANSYRRPGEANASSWVRPDAMLAVILLSDEEDCSYPTLLETYFLSDVERNLPASTSCYVDKAQLRPASQFRDLLIAKKGRASRVALGFIGGVTPATVFPATLGDALVEGQPGDCRLSGGAVDEQCACFAQSYDPEVVGLCPFTALDKTDVAPGGVAANFVCGQHCCEAMAGGRYFEFATGIARHRLDSICQADYSRALAEIALIATLPCFELNVTPACTDPARITQFVSVTRNGNLLPNAEEGSATVGWYYRRDTNELCLNGLDRLLDDEYDVYILHTSDNGRVRGCES